jgi:hypothetical protein
VIGAAKDAGGVDGEKGGWLAGAAGDYDAGAAQDRAVWDRPMDRATVRIDPDRNITITLARGLNLLDVLSSKKVALTETGKALV